MAPTEYSIGGGARSRPGRDCRGNRGDPAPPASNGKNGLDAYSVVITCGEYRVSR